MCLHENPYGKFVMGLGVAGVLVTMYSWWSNTIKEAHRATIRRSSSCTCATG